MKFDLSTMKTESSRSARRPVARPKPPGRFDLWHGLCFLLGVLVTVGLSLRLASDGHGSSHPGGSAPFAGPTSTPPWGQIESTPIVLERPDESLLSERLTLPPPAWFFEHFTEERLAAWLSAGDLTAAQQQQLTNRAHWMAASNGWFVLPPVEVLRTLSATARARIYPDLFKHPLNRSRGRPFQIAADKFEDWLAGCRLPDERAALFRSLTYRHGERLYFADFEVLEAECTLDEQQRLRKAMSQSPALLVRLRVTPDSDIEALARYWSGGRPGQAMKPFLQSLARVPGGASVSVSFFFPTFARLRLYTYPDPNTDPTAARQDCYWTALNFFNERPSNRFFNESIVQKTLHTDYTEVAPPWTFGDLVMLLEEGRTAIHLCVYVAEDVVFTKNGSDPLRPWVLMRIPDMVEEYQMLQGKPVQAIGLRRKAAASP